MAACTVPGRITSSSAGPGWATTAATTGRAASSVTRATAASAEWRDQMPKEAVPAAMAAPHSKIIRVFFIVGLQGSMLRGEFGRDRAAAAVDQREHGGYEQQGGDGGEAQATDHGAAERRVLLAALAQPQRHRHHADDHGQGGHQHRTEAAEAGLDGGAQG